MKPAPLILIIVGLALLSVFLFVQWTNALTKPTTSEREVDLIERAAFDRGFNQASDAYRAEYLVRSKEADHYLGLAVQAASIQSAKVNKVTQATLVIQFQDMALAPFARPMPNFRPEFYPAGDSTQVPDCFNLSPQQIDSIREEGRRILRSDL